MGQKKKNNRVAGKMALEDQESLAADQAAAQELYDADMAKLREFDVTDYYAGLDFKGIPLGPDGKPDMSLAKTERSQLATMDPQERATAQGYTASQTDIAGLARGADTGLSNVFNNLQVSTAGADLAAQEADQSLAASQEAMMMMGGGGGATALASQAAKSKAGISADIDRQVKANEMARAQGEQSLQRDLLAQGNLASQFDLGQSQFNVGQDNQAQQFSAQAQNQASMFNAGQANNMALSKFGAENQMNQFNTNASNNAFANQANAINNAIAQNAQMEQQFDFNKVGGQTQAESNRYDALMNIAEISSNQVNDADRAAGENDAVITQAKMSGMKDDGSYKKKWYESKSTNQSAVGV